MCGISGYFSPGGGQSAEAMRSVAGAMADTLSHRGPDGSGTWVDPDAGIALGHRRLSIIDLSEAGAQPMPSACGRYVLSYNGEIYNFSELRDELESAGRRFRGHCDTEVLLEGIAEWGIEATLKKLIGMFAFALWDREERTLTFARDRLGIKPLYYGWAGRTLLFGSELKALRAHPEFGADVNRDAVAQVLRHGYIPAPLSIYAGISKLIPGTIIEFSAEERDPSPRAYWSLSEVVEEASRRASGNDSERSDREYCDELETLLTDAVGKRMIADVSLGALLSGGIDSSLVVALMQKQSGRPVKSFSIGFSETEYNEAPHAAAVAKHLGTDHTELYVEPRDALDVIPKLPELYDEPFGDSSQIPTYLVSELTRRSVTVALSGDGGDESFGGYERYRVTRDAWNILRLAPGPVRQAAALLGRLGTGRVPGRIPKRIVRRLSRVGVRTVGDLYCAQLQHWTNATDVALESRDTRTFASDPGLWPDALRYPETFLFADTLSYLPDDILVKVDRASMAVGLEARVPLLDHRVVEFAWQMPSRLRWDRRGRGKWPLQEILGRYVPTELFDRPKKGFGVPIDHWLRGPLREWAEELLREDRLREEGYFDPQPIRELWRRHLAGDNWHYLLWNVLMFNAWLERQRSGVAV
ncbi:asparagine synthase (glutamine-hydrolyzing) [Stratiformator vulcanicus]|uniref:asparagine synthase (glutamine-hydrolyzing) n=1 Tax=Stratiformator vulcanicus TaxID=2527980 RepID=A0A517R0T6_9PLAN|nr:asparagine synthase (glutamine-hydrolyzing) [Stratiformator vulcanicus]QDT37466.1 Asparagine synthetase [glutamine-hydrolyzing] 1 [Stratiformator vulcanicus]